MEDYPKEPAPTSPNQQDTAASQPQQDSMNCNVTCITTELPCHTDTTVEPSDHSAAAQFNSVIPSPVVINPTTETLGDSESNIVTQATDETEIADVQPSVPSAASVSYDVSELPPDVADHKTSDLNEQQVPYVPLVEKSLQASNCQNETAKTSTISDQPTWNTEPSKNAVKNDIKHTELAIAPDPESTKKPSQQPMTIVHEAIAFRGESFRWQEMEEDVNISVPDKVEAPVADVGRAKGAVQECVKKDPTETILSTVRAPKKERDVGTSAKQSSSQVPHISQKQHVAKEVSGLFENAVLVQATVFEPVEPMEDVKPVVGGCVDDIGRVDEVTDSLAIEPCGLFVDETAEVQEYDAMAEAESIDPIVPLEVPIFAANRMSEDLATGSLLAASSIKVERGSSGEGSELEPDMMDYGEMIGLATDDEIELKRSMCAKAAARVKRNVQRQSNDSQPEREISSVKEASVKPGNGTMHESNQTSQKPQQKRPRSYKKKHKIHSIRIVDVKKELLNIREHSSDDSADNYTATETENIGKKRKPSINADSGSGLSCEEIVDDDCLHDTPDTKPKRGRRSNGGGSRVNNRQAKKVEEIAGLRLPEHQQQQLKKMVLKKKQPTRDRFYDRSQDIPNDIYFENMNVPLHILHDTSSSSSDEERSVESKYQSSSKYRNSSSSVGRKSANHMSLQTMKMFLKTAGFRHLRYQKLWKDCHSNQDRAEAILRFLHESGLQGEPTFEKCRELRKQIQLENEAKVLDASAIISVGEGRVTRQRTKMLSNPSASPQSDKQKAIEIVQHQPHQESGAQSEAEPSRHNERERNEFGNEHEVVPQSATPVGDDSAECHDKQDVEIGQHEPVQQNAMQSGDDAAASHGTAASAVSDQTKPAEVSEGAENRVINPVLQF